jgi:hypothetical protein
MMVWWLLLQIPKERLFVRIQQGLMVTIIKIECTYPMAELQESFTLLDMVCKLEMNLFEQDLFLKSATIPYFVDMHQ